MQAAFRESDPATVRSAYRAAIDAVGALSAAVGALLEDAEAEPVESEASRRRGLMIVETAMELAGTGRRAA